MRDALLYTLSDGAWHSGQELADRAGLTRAAIWKAIEALRAEGYEIEARSRRGYRLLGVHNFLNGEALSALCPEVGKVEYHEEIGSTNDRAIALAQAGAEAGTVVLADRQVTGKGRRGRSFYSPAGTGLYLSLVLRPTLPAREATLLTVAAAVSVAQAAEALGAQGIGIKWVNDIYCYDRKCAGILTEANLSIEDGGLEWAVIGIGVNVYQAPDVPEEIAQRYGALFEAPGADPLLRARLAAGILEHLRHYERHLEARRYLGAYRERLLYRGETVELVQGKRHRYVRAIDIDRDGALVIENEKGKREHIASGEVSLRPTHA